MVLALAAAFQCAAKQKVIFDTDMGNDIDDALALLMLYDYRARGDCELAAVLVNKDNPCAPVFIDLVAEFYGVNDVPIGRISGGTTKESGRFVEKVSRETLQNGKFKYARKISYDTVLPDAVKLARKILAESDDRSVVYVSVGFSTNVSRLLNSMPDENSPLNGTELVEKKVKYFSVMAGEFRNTARPPVPEYNVKMDIASARNFFAKSPVPIVFSGFEIGNALPFPHSEVDKFGADNPVAEAYNLYAWAIDKKNGRHDRPSWDLTSVLYVFSPAMFEVSEPGTVTLDEKGGTVFTPSPEGIHCYLKLDPAKKKTIIDELVRRASIKPAR